MYSTKDAGQEPFSFQIGKGDVIKGKLLLCFLYGFIMSYHIYLILIFERFLLTGWDEGVMGMQIGEVARLRVR